MMDSDGGCRRLMLCYRPPPLPPLPPRGNKEGKMEAEVWRLDVRRPRTAHCGYFLLLFRVSSLRKLSASPLSLPFLGFSLFFRGGWTGAPQRRTFRPGLSHGGGAEQGSGRYFKPLHREKGAETLKYVEDGYPADVSLLVM